MVLAVVDPAVGTSRRSIAVEVGDGASVLVGPDNGVLAPAVALCGGATRAVEITNPDYVLPTEAATFDGRDVFAPAAAHLCLGVDLAELGPPIDPVSLFPAMVPLTREEEGRLHAEVLWVDRYGNAQLNVDPEELEDHDDTVLLVMDDGNRSARRTETFATLEPDQLGLIVDSYGLVAIVLDRKSAAAELGLVGRLGRHHRSPRRGPSLGRRHPRQPRPPPLILGATLVRPGTVIALGALLLIILGAAVLQLFILAK